MGSTVTLEHVCGVMSAAFGMLGGLVGGTVNVFHGGHPQNQNRTSKAYPDLGGLAVFSRKIFGCYKHPEITSGTFLDQRFLKA